jgi:hypothetical protein
LRYPKKDTLPGGDPRKLGEATEKQKAAIIEAMKANVGKVVACEQAGITIAVFNRACAKDKKFRELVTHYEAIIDENLNDVMYVAALAEGGASMAANYARLRMEREARVHARRMDKIKAAQKEEELKIKRMAYETVSANYREQSIKYGNYSLDELTRLEVLENRLGEDSMTDDEMREYVKLMAKGKVQQKAIEVQGQAIAALNGVQRVEEEFKDEEDDYED